MRIIKTAFLKEFYTKHPQAEQSIKAWVSETKKAKWKNTNDIKKLYRSADFLTDNRVIFNICGNKYRLIVKINFDYGIVYTRFIGTHAEYDKINAKVI